VPTHRSVARVLGVRRVAEDWRATIVFTLRNQPEYSPLACHGQVAAAFRNCQPSVPLAVRRLGSSAASSDLTEIGVFLSAEARAERRHGAQWGCRRAQRGTADGNQPGSYSASVGGLL
jgi:hypothetical protein